MASAMRKMAVYLGLVEDDHRYDDHYQDEYGAEEFEHTPSIGSGLLQLTPGAHADTKRPADWTDVRPHRAAAAVTEGAGGASYYVQISAEGLYAGSGYYHFESDQLQRFRDLGAARVNVTLPAEGATQILPILDRWAVLIRQLRG